MIRFTSSGSTKNMEKFLRNLKNKNFALLLQACGKKGVEALQKATPKETGLAGSSWQYRIRQNGRAVTIEWYNTNTENKFDVAVALQYGYTTGTGGYIRGRDYINPAMKPVFDEISDVIWKAVKSS